VGGVPIHHIPPAFFTVPKDGVIVALGKHVFGGLDGAGQCKDILDAQERGAKLIAIDPYFHVDGAKADQWIPIKPGTDNAFLLGAINHLIVKKLYDKDFVENWVREGDFDKLVAFIGDKTPEAMSAICDIAPDVIRGFAEDCAKANGAVAIDAMKSIMLGNAMDACHAWVIFTFLTGAMDAMGGQPLPDITPVGAVEPVPPFANVGNLMEKGFHRSVDNPDREKFDKYGFPFEPTWYEARAIELGSLKVLYAGESNPALTEMGQNNWQKMVCEKDEKGNYKLEMLISSDIQLSETGRFADIVLPDASFFERWEMLYMPWWYNFGHAVFVRQPVVEPLGECRHMNNVFIELGKRLVPDYFQNFNNSYEYYDLQLAALGLSMQKVLDMGGIWNTQSIGFKKYKDRGGFPSPWKKARIYWEEVEMQPWNQALPRPEPAPEYLENVEEYPFVLVSIRQLVTQGTGQWAMNNPSVRDPISGSFDNPVIINTTVANKLGLKEGDKIKLQSPPPWGGEVEIAVHLTEGIRPDCIGMFHGYGSTVGRVASMCGVSDNLLIPDSGYTLDWQDLVGAESHVSTRVKIVK